MQQDVLDELDDLLGTAVPKGDAILLMGDFNVQLGRDGKCTGKWCIHRDSNSGGAILEDILMRHNMVAVSTFFRPRSWGVRHRRHHRPGARARRRAPGARGRFRGTGNATYIPPGRDRPPRQLDYVCVSRRWASSVLGTRCRWGPSLTKHGRPADHCLLEMRWRDRLRCPSPQERPVDRRRLRESLEVQLEFENEVKERLGEREVCALLGEANRGLPRTGAWRQGSCSSLLRSKRLRGAVLGRTSFERRRERRRGSI